MIDTALSFMQASPISPGELKQGGNCTCIYPAFANNFASKDNRWRCLLRYEKFNWCGGSMMRSLRWVDSQWDYSGCLC